MHAAIPGKGFFDAREYVRAAKFTLDYNTRPSTCNSPRFTDIHIQVFGLFQDRASVSTEFSSLYASADGADSDDVIGRTEQSVHAAIKDCVSNIVLDMHR